MKRREAYVQRLREKLQQKRDQLTESTDSKVPTPPPRREGRTKLRLSSSKERTRCSGAAVPTEKPTVNLRISKELVHAVSPPLRSSVFAALKTTTGPSFAATLLANVKTKAFDTPPPLSLQIDHVSRPMPLTPLQCLDADKRLMDFNSLTSAEERTARQNEWLQRAYYVDIYQECFAIFNGSAACRPTLGPHALFIFYDAIDRWLSVVPYMEFLSVADPPSEPPVAASTRRDGETKANTFPTLPRSHAACYHSPTYEINPPKKSESKVRGEDGMIVVTTRGQQIWVSKSFCRQVNKVDRGSRKGFCWMVHVAEINMSLSGTFYLDTSSYTLPFDQQRGTMHLLHSPWSPEALGREEEKKTEESPSSPLLSDRPAKVCAEHIHLLPARGAKGLDPSAVVAMMATTALLHKISSPLHSTTPNSPPA